jgi:hypothetical protein
VDTPSLHLKSIRAVLSTVGGGAIQDTPEPFESQSPVVE